MRALTAVLIVGWISAVALAQDAGGKAPPADAPVDPNAPAVKKDSPEKAKPAARRKANAAAMLPAVLRKVQFNDVPLSDVFDQLADRARVNIVVRWNQLNAAGVEPTTPVTLDVEGLTLGKVLRMVMEEVAQPDDPLAYRADDQMILISTARDINSRMVTKVYDILDVVLPEDTNAYFASGTQVSYIRTLQPRVAPGAAAQAPVIDTIDTGVRIDFGFEREEDEPTPEELRQQIQDLIDVIQTTIEPETWAINGGPGVIRAFRNTLVIRNSQFVHQQIAASGILP